MARALKLALCCTAVTALLAPPPKRITHTKPRAMGLAGPVDPAAALAVSTVTGDVRKAMTDIFERNYRCYGSRRIHASLADRSMTVSEKVVRRLMKEECLVAATSKRRRYGSYMGEISPAPDNLLNRDFSASAVVWVVERTV